MIKYSLDRFHERWWKNNPKWETNKGKLILFWNSSEVLNRRSWRWRQRTYTLYVSRPESKEEEEPSRVSNMESPVEFDLWRRPITNHICLHKQVSILSTETFVRAVNRICSNLALCTHLTPSNRVRNESAGLVGCWGGPGPSQDWQRYRPWASRVSITWQGWILPEYECLYWSHFGIVVSSHQQVRCKEWILYMLMI